MKIRCVNTINGLVPIDADSYELKRNLTIGQSYECDIKLLRSYQFHKKFFSMLNTAWALLPEKTQHGFRSFEGFRAYLLVAAGFYETYYSPRLKEFVEIPRSMSFASMDEAEFSDCYERVKDVIWAILSSRVNITQAVFEQYLSNY